MERQGRDQGRDGDYLRRREFEGFVRRHEDDPFSHALMATRLQQEGLVIRENFENRIGKLEQWRDRIIGAVTMLTFLVGAGVIAGVVELLRK